MRAMLKSVLTAVSLVLVAGSALMVAAPLAAQAPGVDIRLNPRIGLYAPLTDLTEDSFGSYKLDNSLAVGLGVEFDFAMLPVGVRANLDYATSSSVDFEDTSFEDTNETTLLALVGDVVFRPLPRVVVLQPYLFAGAGIKQYDFSWEGADPDVIESESDGTFHIGGGLDFALGPMALNAEVSDYISSFEPEGASDSTLQHDVFVSIGFVIGLL